jgi:hypothetical protein
MNIVMLQGNVSQVSITQSVFDLFTDSNGTLLQNHKQDGGGTWVAVNSNMQIQSNSAQAGTSGTTAIAKTNLGTGNGYVGVDVTLPGSGKVSVGPFIEQSDSYTGFAALYENDGSSLTIKVIQFNGLI